MFLVFSQELAGHDRKEGVVGWMRRTGAKLLDASELV